MRRALQADAHDARTRTETWLVEVFHDKRVKPVCSAEAPPEQLFTQGDDARIAATEFARSVSRLTEMQSAAYLQSEKPNR